MPWICLMVQRLVGPSSRRGNLVKPRTAHHDVDQHRRLGRQPADGCRPNFTGDAGWPGAQGSWCLPRLEFARFLHDGSEVQMNLPEREAGQLSITAETLLVHLPIIKPDAVVPVIELTLK